MSRERLFESDNLLPGQINPELWPDVDISCLSESNKKLFIDRKTAILMYFKRLGTQTEIKEATNIDKQNLRRLIKRCMLLDESGMVWGFRGLIPYKKVKSYSLSITKPNRNESRKTGEFKLLLERYPDMRDMIDDLYLGRNRRSLEPAMKPKHIHKRFIEECRKIGISHMNYPFNTKWMGYKALQRYLNQLKYQYFIKSSSRYGENAETKARYTGIGEQNHPSTLTPYQKVQFDAHRIDGFFAVEFKTPEGDLITKVLERFWILTIIDVATRNILGYSISLNKEYSASDVMNCVRNAVIPHQRINLTIDGLSYNHEAGFPAEIFPEYASWAVWDVICFDNAKSHYANIVRDRLKNLIGCAINLGPVALPMRRSLIERFFKTLEESGIHRLPNTTGSNPKDPIRNNPEKNAIKWNITYDHLKELIDVMISNYNGTPHGGIYHQTPLELLEKRCKNGLIPRKLEEVNRSEMLFLQTSIRRTVRGSLATGKRPYIQYLGVEYRNEKLAQSAHLLSKELFLHVNVDDLRTVKAFLEDGSEFGYLTAVGKWSLTAHSIQTRKAINSLVQRKLIHYTNFDDPIFVYTDYLMKNAREGKKRSLNKLTQIREASDIIVSEPKERVEALENAKQHNEALENVRNTRNKMQHEIELNHYENMLTKFKTKSM